MAKILTEEEIEVLVKAHRILIKIDLQRVAAIRLILKHGEKFRCEVLYWLVGKEKFDGWLKIPRQPKRKSNRQKSGLHRPGERLRVWRRSSDLLRTPRW